ncbi:N-acetylglucosamine-6-phosphate deacetylase [Mycoplasma sp. CSL7503-lung]|uniref:N-acetylglucosamine-6-phosphate deacetylase n=1 Tax=Mycoplasma sp. CSL7503-lung TaxID=536372 RepID=UPI0021D388D0|nr:N-acetylglucosamine-6-phosphate deacetylase [Mycoplasma sp. CSL7503-lung]MCU4706517.1 N-acetylglucosamine-6-phosphate deacetylase [Mycoplasma sp. CSL7503-lung]
MNNNIIKIENVKIINPEKTIKNADLYIKDNKIFEIVEKDGEGQALLVPGFIDTHIHGIYNQDVMDGTNAVKIISKKLANHGVTSFMPTAMTNSWKTILKALKDVSENKTWVSRNLGIHIEGPFIGMSKKGAHKPEYLIKGTKTRVDKMYKTSNNMLKKISFDPLMVNLDVFKYMQSKLGIIGSIGHSSASFQIADKFFKNGCYSVCHMWNAMSGVDSRNPGLLEAALYNNDVYTELIIDLLHVSKESIDFSIKLKGVDKIIAISDSIKPAYAPNGENISGDIPVIKKGNLITLKGTNTIAGSGITIHDAFKNIVKIGYSLNDAVKMTSYNSAKYLNIQNLGKIESGFLADLVILDKDTLKIKEVYIDGKKIKG